MKKILLITVLLLTSVSLNAAECNKDVANRCTAGCTMAQEGKKIADDKYKQCFNSCMSTCDKAKTKKQ